MEQAEKASSGEKSTPADYPNTRNQPKEVETITPAKKDFQNNLAAGLESLKSRNRRSGNSFKRREALNKGWTNDPSQMKIDKFLVPKRRNKVENSRFTMMG